MGLQQYWLFHLVIHMGFTLIIACISTGPVNSQLTQMCLLPNSKKSFAFLCSEFSDGFRISQFIRGLVSDGHLINAGPLCERSPRTLSPDKTFSFLLKTGMQVKLWHIMQLQHFTVDSITIAEFHDYLHVFHMTMAYTDY